jgi:hypothetical protein
MATRAMRPTLSAERRFFLGISVAFLAAAFIGFAPSYYLLGAMHGRTGIGGLSGSNLTPLVHIHAFLFSAWPILLVAQSGLVSARRTDIHRTLGMAGAGLAAAMLVIGTLTAIEGSRLGHMPPGWTQEAFLLMPLSNIWIFAGIAAVAIAWRNRAAYHKRLIVLATTSAIIPATVRIVQNFLPPPVPRGVPGGMLIADLFILALVAFDLRQRGKLHPVTLWGGGLFLLSEPLRMWFAQTALWQDFAHRLIA